MESGIDYQGRKSNSVPKNKDKKARTAYKAEKGSQAFQSLLTKGLKRLETKVPLH